MERRSKERVPEMEIYTDGSCKKLNNVTFGGWAFVVVKDSEEQYAAAGSIVNTTNQRMELLAIANALEYASLNRRVNEKVTIYSDSAYAVNCYLNEWYIGWLNSGWHTSTGKPVANQDLWERIIPYFDSFWYELKKVEGHAGVYWNEYCDEKAQYEAAYAKTHWRG